MDNHEFSLAQQIAELKGITQTGFDGINSHLAQLNSKVAKHEERLNDATVKASFESGKKSGIQMTWKAFWAATGAIGGFGGIVITLIQIAIQHYSHK